ncbi:unnamed protein product [Closterium sp. Yama58-4]|nr:unnamed protein product [Closterium sp. Yama58-4]
MVERAAYQRSRNASQQRRTSQQQQQQHQQQQHQQGQSHSQVAQPSQQPQSQQQEQAHNVSSAAQPPNAQAQAQAQPAQPAQQRAHQRALPPQQRQPAQQKRQQLRQTAVQRRTAQAQAARQTAGDAGKAQPGQADPGKPPQGQGGHGKAQLAGGANPPAHAPLPPLPRKQQSRVQAQGEQQGEAQTEQQGGHQAGQQGGQHRGQQGGQAHRLQQESSQQQPEPHRQQHNSSGQDATHGQASGQTKGHLQPDGQEPGGQPQGHGQGTGQSSGQVSEQLPMHEGHVEHAILPERPDWLDDYEIVGKIGEGTYGLVYLAKDRRKGKGSGRSALKKFKQTKEGDGVSPTAIREIMDQLRSGGAMGEQRGEWGREGTYGLVYLAKDRRKGKGSGRSALKKFKQTKEGDGVSPTAICEIMRLGEGTPEKIGEGTYGLVYLAKDRRKGKGSGRSALKKFKQTKEGDGVSPTAIREIMTSFEAPQKEWEGECAHENMVYVLDRLLLRRLKRNGRGSAHTRTWCMCSIDFF